MTGGTTDQASTKGGNVGLRRVSAPNQVDPGEPFQVDVEVSNGAAYINPWDPDKCGLAPPGYKIEVVLKTPAGETLSKGPLCHTTTEVGTRDVTYTFTVDAPDDPGGRAEVEAHVELAESGKRTDAVEASTLVSDEAASQPSDPGGGGGGLPDDLPGGGDGGTGPLPDSIGGQVDRAVLLLGLLAVAWIAASASDATEAITDG